MNIAYLDLNEDDHFEDYSTTPDKYGGGRIIGAALLNRLDNFFLFANEKCFKNIDKNKISQCIPLSLEARQGIKNGEPVKKYIKNIDDYDIFFHHFHYTYLNLEGHKNKKQVVWPIGWREIVHDDARNILLFDREVQETIYNQNAKIYKIVIGPKFEAFEQRRKENFIFQCSKHNNFYQSIEIAILANKYKIKTYFSGPIDPGYELLRYIDNVNTFYLGVISHELKKDFFKKAKANMQIQNYPISATLTGKEASSFGVPILATPIGGWNAYIKHGVNGFFIQNEQDFINAWMNIDNIKQKDCYNLGSIHSEDNMVKLTLEALEDVYKN